MKVTMAEEKIRRLTVLSVASTFKCLVEYW
jgi:hypothetical protein